MSAIMTAIQRCNALLLMSSLLLPLSAAQAIDSTPKTEASPAMLLARGGGGRARGGGGHRVQTGFQGAGSGLNRGDARPSGGWSQRLGSDSARPSLDRSVAKRDRQGLQQPQGDRLSQRDGSRDLSRPGNRELSRDGARTLNRDVNSNVSRNWNRTVNIDNVNLSPGWARPGWGVARPWSYGWYGGWSTPAWGWWGARAATWGIASLTTAAIINNAVDNAIAESTSYIVVPNSSYQLLYGTVTPTNGSSISFDVTASDTTYQLSADCRAGTLNGQQPTSAAEAELLNAACQVAFGSVS